MNIFYSVLKFPMCFLYFCDFQFASHAYLVQNFVLTSYSTISYIKATSSYILPLIFQDRDTFTTTIYHWEVVSSPKLKNVTVGIIKHLEKLAFEIGFKIVVNKTQYCNNCNRYTMAALFTLWLNRFTWIAVFLRAKFWALWAPVTDNPQKIKQLHEENMHVKFCHLNYA